MPVMAAFQSLENVTALFRDLKKEQLALWEAGRQDEARSFYSRIVQRFDRPDAPPIVKSAVRGAKARLL